MIDANLISFSPLQREVIDAVIEGYDVFLQASTSFGKSLCFQLPAVISTGCESVPIHLARDIEPNH